MNATVNPTTAPTGTQSPAARGAADGAAATREVIGGETSDSKAKPAKPKDSGTGIGGMFGELWENIKEFFSNFKENGSIGSILGGIIGLGGAWLAGNFFGGGIISTILMVALAIPMMLIGSDSIGGWINNWLGHGDKSRGGDSPERSQSRTASVATQRAAAASPQQATPSFTPSMTLTNEELLAMVNPTNGPDNNTRDRLEIFVDPNDATRRLQVRPVEDSVADRLGIITLDELREQVGSSATGIVFGQALNGVVSVQAAPMAALPGAPAAQGRA